MKTSVFADPIARLRLMAIAVAAFLSGGCLVAPPTEDVQARDGLVRAGTLERAQVVASALDRLAPGVLERVPDSRRCRLEVWVQDVPALYEHQADAYSDADGFFAEQAGRIHLRDGSDHIERTLAHELVHASLGPSWKSLPGTLEEGLCDYVSTLLCPDAAGRLAAGRLSSAAFATGGLSLDVDLAEPATERAGEHDVCWSARLRLEGEPRVNVDPFRVFDLEAGLSSTALSGVQKKAYYGIAYLLVRRIAERVGLEGLHELCLRANAEGLDQIPAERVLEAAGLGLDRAGLRGAILAAFGPAELEALVGSHPEFLAATVARYLAPLVPLSGLREELESLEAFVAVTRTSSRGLAIASLAPFGDEIAAAVVRERPAGIGR